MSGPVYISPTEEAVRGNGATGRAGLRLRELALAAVAATLGAAAGEAARPAQEAGLLQEVGRRVLGGHGSLVAALAAFLSEPPPEDAPLTALADDLGLSPTERLAVALAAAVEDDLLVGRLLAYVQAPVGRSRPTLGLLSRAFAPFRGPSEASIPALLDGAAFRTGLLVAADEGAPLPERPVRVPVPLSFAFAGRDGRWPGATIGLEEGRRVPLPPSAVCEARRHAAALQEWGHGALVLRTGSDDEGRSVAAEVAEALARRPVYLEPGDLAGLGPWLRARRLLPVLCLTMGPGDRYRLPKMAGYEGPLVVLCGPDGAVEAGRGTMAEWALSVPPRPERHALWTTAVHDEALAAEIAGAYRHGAGRITHLGRQARHQAVLAGRTRPERRDLLAAAWSGSGAGLDALAEPLRVQVPDDALVTPPALRRDLEALLLRCRLRDDLADGLGPALATRYRPGLRTLFTGASGTGKTLTAGWIATRLGLPLYRVDLASVTSKYIGETEKNLSQLLARAEHAEVILLFDEADSLFGKRTDVSGANDRFANAQTNYLLQRIENYDGIVVLTSNSQARFDPAFTRRLDFTIEFPSPGPEERRALWRAHLGPHFPLAPSEFNRLAVLLDLTGGEIRNVVLAAAARARNADRSVGFEDIVAGAEAELRKLGRQLPVDLCGGS